MYTDKSTSIIDTHVDLYYTKYMHVYTLKCVMYFHMKMLMIKLQPVHKNQYTAIAISRTHICLHFFDEGPRRTATTKNRKQLEWSQNRVEIELKRTGNKAQAESNTGQKINRIRAKTKMDKTYVRITKKKSALKRNPNQNRTKTDTKVEPNHTSKSDSTNRKQNRIKNRLQTEPKRTQHNSGKSKPKQTQTRNKPDGKQNQTRTTP